MTRGSLAESAVDGLYCCRMLQNQPVVWSVDSVEFLSPVSNVPTTFPAFNTKEQTADGRFHQVMMSWVSLVTTS
jgi:hypothetical protein